MLKVPSLQGLLELTVPPSPPPLGTDRTKIASSWDLKKSVCRDLMVPCALNILVQLSDAYGTPADDTTSCHLTYLHSRHEQSISCPILQVKKLRLQAEVPMLVASFYPLHPTPASLVWPRTPFLASIRGLSGFQGGGRENGVRVKQCGEEA